MYILTFTLVFTQFIQMSSAVLNVTIDAFSVHCGSKEGGVMNVKFNTSEARESFSIYANNKPEECPFLHNGTYYILENARRNGCAVKDRTAPYPAYYLIVFVQEDPLIQRVSDSKFLLSCVYTSGQVNVSSSELRVKDTTWNIKDYHWEVIHGYIDMSYELGIYADDGIFKTPIVTVNFGEKMALKIEMSGIDEDEKGIRVRTCTAKSGGKEAVFISNFCSTSSLLERNVGFVSNGTWALLRGLEAFRLAGSEDMTLTFECLLDICPAPCDGFNCRPRVKRQINRINQYENEARVFGSWPVKVVDRKLKTEEIKTLECVNQIYLYTMVGCMGSLVLVCVILVYSLIRSRQRQGRRATVKNQP